MRSILWCFTFEVYLYSLVVACPFSHRSLYIWNHYGNVFVVVVSSNVVVVVVGFVVCGTWSSAGVVLAFKNLL